MEILGENGIGKSTLFLQAADSMAKAGKTLYVSGEESGEQVKMRADRLGVSGELLFLAETQLEVILETIKKEEPKFATCPNCHEPVMPHRVCSNCGYYDGKQVVVKKETENA